MIILEDRKLIETKFRNEQEIEDLVIANSEHFFGPSSIFIPKAKIKTKDGVCFASIKTEKEISAIQAEISKSAGIEQNIRYLEAIKDATRFKIVYLLLRYKHLCVCDLANILDVSSSAISQHLRKLKDMNIVSITRQKQTLFYSVKDREFAIFFKAFNYETKNKL